MLRRLFDGHTDDYIPAFHLAPPVENVQPCDSDMENAAALLMECTSISDYMCHKSNSEYQKTVSYFEFSNFVQHPQLWISI